MALNNFKCNHLTPLPFKGLMSKVLWWLIMAGNAVQIMQSLQMDSFKCERCYFVFNPSCKNTLWQCQQQHLNVQCNAQRSCRWSWRLMSWSSHWSTGLVVSLIFRVRPIPCWRPMPDTIGRSCSDTDTGNDVPHNLGQTYVTYVVHTVRTLQNITLCFETYSTNYRLETIGVHATVLTVETGKRTTGIGADTKINIGRYRYPPILASVGRYPILVSV